jgi:hypothetical protein
VRPGHRPHDGQPEPTAVGPGDPIPLQPPKRLEKPAQRVGGDHGTTEESYSALFLALGGVAVTTAYALDQDWPAVLPPEALLGGVGIAALVGALTGAYPAMRAARLTPTEALA